jgi:hypothetical protein
MSTPNEPEQRATRQSQYCTFGTLDPEATQKEFKTVGNMQQLQQKLEPYPVFRELMRRAQSEANTSFLDQVCALPCRAVP